MPHYTKVISVRLDTELVDAVRERARADGRSLSGEIVYFVREQVAVRPRARKPLPITGWLAGRPTLETASDLRTARDELSAHLKRAVQEKARRK